MRERRASTSTPIRARTHIHFGIVAIVGFKQREVGLKQFRKALEVQPDIKLTKQLATPELQDAFEEAVLAGEGRRRRRATAGGGGEPAAATATAEAPGGGGDDDGGDGDGTPSVGARRRARRRATRTTTRRRARRARSSSA